jgi:unconventional prefoldin RPB5 interactor 1
MGIPNHDLNALEERRLTLEDNILQLQKSLYHWRNWEAEYDGFRDAISDLENDATTDDFIAAGRDLGGELVTDTEVQAIVGGNQGITRSRGQVVALIGRRIDYVKQNVATMEKRLRAAEDELYNLDSSDTPVDGGAFAVKEIMEELDEEGNVVSSSINTPGDQASQLLETLKKAGVQDIPENVTAAATSGEASNEVASSASEQEEDNMDTAEDQAQQTTTSNGRLPETNGAFVQEEEIDLSKPVSLVTAEDREQPPVTDIDESAEDARLRREMLQYGIDEVGAIVAELELDEEGSEFSVDEDEYDWDDDEENEDEFGRSHTVLSDDYHQQMRELEAKLNARGMYNVGKDSAGFPEDIREDLEKPPAAIVSQDEPEASKGKKPKKRVAFADDLDIAPAPEAPAAEPRTLPPQADVPVLLDAIVERTDRSNEAPATVEERPKKVSKFKSARASTATDETTGPSTNPPPISKPSTFAEARTRKHVNAVPSNTTPELFPATPQQPKPFSAPITVPWEPAVPQPPEGKTLADTLVEREIAPGAAAPEPDELDESIHRREIASEFYKVRNRMIHQQGGFVNNEQENELIEEEGQPRISKFRAARMR